jgi:hypothetical protein
VEVVVADKPKKPAKSLGVPGRLKDWNHQRTTVYGHNALERFETAPEHAVSSGRAFFPTWQEDAAHLGAHSENPSVERGAAILAQLSPSQEATRNRMMAYQLVHLDAPSRARVHVAMQLHEQAQALPAGHPERKGLVAQAKSHLAPVTQGTPLAFQTLDNVFKAFRLHQGAHEEPLQALRGNKIRDFGTAIATGGESSRQTVDTHYHDAMLGRTNIPYAQPRGLGSVGRYEGLSRAAEFGYQKGVERGTVPDTPTGRQDFMAVAWTNQQQKKIDSNANARRSRKASATVATNLLANAPQSDPARYGGRKIDPTGGLKF